MAIDTGEVATWLQRNYYEPKGFSTGHSRTRANTTSSALNGLTPDTLNKMIFANGGLRSNLLGVGAEVLVRETVFMIAPVLDIRYSPVQIDRMGTDILLQYPNGDQNLYLGVGVKLQKTFSTETLNAIDYPEMPVIHVAIGPMGRDIMKDYFLSLFSELTPPRLFLQVHRIKYQPFFCYLANEVCRGLESVNTRKRPNLRLAKDTFMRIFSQKVVGEDCD